MRGSREGLLVLSLLVIACGGGTEPSGGGGGGGGGGPTCTSTSANVTINNNSFTPSCTTVPPGTTITWNWGSNASNGHNVTFSTGPNSGTETTGSFQRTFPSAGTFNYECTVHPGMDGQIRVVQ